MHKHENPAVIINIASVLFLPNLETKTKPQVYFIVHKKQATQFEIFPLRFLA